MNVHDDCAEKDCAEGLCRSYMQCRRIVVFCSCVLVCLASYAYCLVVFILICVLKCCCSSAEHVLKCLCVLIAIVSTTI